MRDFQSLVPKVIFWCIIHIDLFSFTIEGHMANGGTLIDDASTVF